MRASEVAHSVQAVLMPDGNVVTSMGRMSQRTGHQHLMRTGQRAEALKRLPAWVPGNVTKTLEEDVVMLRDASHNQWVTLFAVVLLLMIVDALVAKRLPAGSFKCHISMLIAWIACGLGYSAFYFRHYGSADGMDWIIGYALEWMLSLDNLFAFQLMFRACAAPILVQEKIVFYGVLGSIGTRALLFCSLAHVMHTLQYCQLFLGIILVYAGIRSLLDDDDSDDGDNKVWRTLKHIMGNRLKESWDPENNRFFVSDSEDGRLCATLLFPLMLGVIILDVIFAVDSVSAKLAQIPDRYIAYSSSVLAMLGLRAMFFVIDDIVKCFELLKYGVGFILIFIGIEIVFAHRFHLPHWAVLSAITAILSLCIIGSIFKESFQRVWNSLAATVSRPRGDGGQREDMCKKHNDIRGCGEAPTRGNDSH